MMKAAVTLYWLPLGAGGHFVRHNGRMFEAVVARREHREPRDLYHAALEVELEGDRFTVEMGPAWNIRTADRGVVQTGPVGHPWLGHSVLFRYEVRCWRGGTIPDLAEAVAVELQLAHGLATCPERPRHGRHQPANQRARTRMARRRTSRRTTAGVTRVKDADGC